MTILFHWPEGNVDLWRRSFAEIVGPVRVETVETAGRAGDVEYAVVWAPPFGLLKTFPNLRAIFSIGAGVTHITDDPELPAHVPVVRLSDDMLVLDMSAHVIHWVLHFHRFYYRYRAYQAEELWRRHRYPDNAGRTVGILGLGRTGTDAAARLRGLEFPVLGWSRTAKSVDGMECRHGLPGLGEVLARSDILVNLLPLTSETADLLNAERFALMPDGSFLINPSRGGTIVDEDLIAALDSGKLEAAALDVFREEPLPPGHPFWRHPKVHVTPHAAAASNERSAARFIARNIRTMLDGGQPSPIVDRKRGY